MVAFSTPYSEHILKLITQKNLPSTDHPFLIFEAFTLDVRTNQSIIIIINIEATLAWCLGPQLSKFLTITIAGKNGYTWRDEQRSFFKLLFLPAPWLVTRVY